MNRLTTPTATFGSSRAVRRGLSRFSRRRRAAMVGGNRTIPFPHMPVAGLVACLACLAMAFAVRGAEGPTAAQPAPAVRQAAPAPAAQPAPAAVQRAPVAINNGVLQPKNDAPDADDPFSTGASLETDPEVDSLLHRAKELVAEGSFRDAAVIYQHVLDNNGDLMVLAASREPSDSSAKTPERIYRPLQEHVERLLMAPEGRELLAAYRLSADPEAEAVLRSDERRFSESELRQVVRRFFASTHGAVAAYRLGCLLLDRHEYTGARRMFVRVLAEHPDTSLPRTDVLLRLAVANARAGDPRSAEAAIAELQPGGPARPEIVAKIRDEIAASGPPPAVETAGWHMDLGTPARDGRMKALGADSMHRSPFWTEAWQYESHLRAPQPSRGHVVYGVAGQHQSRGQIVSRWKSGGWLPAGDLLMDAGRVYAKTHAFRDADGGKGSGAGLICFDAFTGKLLWFAPDDPGPGAGMSGRHMIFHSGYQGSAMPGSPTTAEEIELFSNSLGRSMTLFDGLVFHLEGQPPFGPRQGLVQVVVNNQIMMGTLGHALVAIDAATGRRRWRAVGSAARMRSPQEQAFGQAAPSGDDRVFLAPPIKAGSSLLIPALRNGAMLLQALTPEDGRVLWERTLCVEPGPAGRCSPVGLAVEGSEVYVATGAGLVFALDAADGRILWAARYPRELLVDANARTMRMMGMYAQLPMAGWSRDVVIPRGGVLLVMPSDAKKIFYLDRRSGELLGVLDQGEAKYVLGVLGDRLYVAGNNCVSSASAVQPRRIWTAGSEQGISGSVGRGALTDQALYIPLPDAIVLLDPEDGKPLGRICVDAADRDPVGNLVSDGTHLVAAGMERIYALVDGAAHLARLQERIDKGDVEAMLARAGIRKRLGQSLEALADLRLAYQATRSDSDKQARLSHLLDGLLTAARRQPDKAAALLEEAAQLAKTHDHRVRIDVARARRQIDLGQVEEALPALTALALDPGAILVPVDGEDLQCRALSSQVATGELARIVQRGDAATRQRLAERARTELSGIEARAGGLKNQPGIYAASLLAVSRALDGTEAAGEAGRKAAAHFQDQGHLELAEIVLREACRSSHASTAAAGSTMLAELHRRMGVPDAAERAALPSMPKPPWKLLWRADAGFEVALADQPGGVSRSVDRCLLIGTAGSQELLCLDLYTGKRRWALAVPPITRQVSQGAGRTVSYPVWQLQGAGLARDGHVALLRRPNEILAIGLLHGKRLWETFDSKQPAKTAVSPNIQHLYRSSYGYPVSSVTPFDARDGLGAQIVPDDSGRASLVEVRDLVTGKVLWDHKFDPEFVRGVNVNSGYILVALQDSDELVVCDRATGAERGRFKIKSQPPYNWFTVAEGGVISNTPDGIVMRRLPDGRVDWTLPAATMFVQRVNQPDAATLCIAGHEATGKGRAMVIDVRRGAVIAEFSSQPGAGMLNDIGLTPDGRQVYFIVPDQQARTRIGILDLASARITGTISLGRLDRALQAKDLAAAGDIFPVAARDPLIKTGNSFRSTNLHTVWFVRKTDGKVIKGLKLPTDRADGKFQNLQQIKLRGDVLLVFCAGAVYAYGHDPAGRPPPQEEAVEPSSVIPDPYAQAQGFRPGPAAPSVITARRVDGGKIAVEVQPTPPAEKDQPPKPIAEGPR